MVENSMRNLILSSLAILSILGTACTSDTEGGEAQNHRTVRNRPVAPAPGSVDPRANWTFEQWCRATGIPSERAKMNPGAINTVARLLSISEERDCASADRKLNSMDVIFASGNGLRNAEPFMAFKRAKTIFLDDNHFTREQIAKLSVLTNLEILSVKYNSYTGITCPLTRPDALCSLDSGDVFVTASR